LEKEGFIPFHSWKNFPKVLVLLFPGKEGIGQRWGNLTKLAIGKERNYWRVARIIFSKRSNWDLT